MDALTAMKQALEALDPHDHHDLLVNLRTAIAEMENSAVPPAPTFRG